MYFSNRLRCDNTISIPYSTCLQPQVTAKLDSWKANYLSMGGRLTLINSVLIAIPTYYLSVLIYLKGWRWKLIVSVGVSCGRIKPQQILAIVWKIFVVVKLKMD